MFDCFRLDVAPDPDIGYRTVYNAEYMDGIGAILNQLNTVTRLFLTLLLFLLNAVIIHLFRTKFIAQSKVVFTDKAERKRKDNERTLTILSICQSSFIFLDTCGTLVAYMLFYVAPYAYFCGDVAAYGLYIVMWAIRAADVLLIVAVSKQFRLMVIQVMPCLKTCMNRVETTVTVSTAK